MSGITADTWRRLIVDEGVAYLNYGEDDQMILGATNGGVTFSFEALETRSPEIDGVKGRLAGVSRITRASPQIEVNLVEFRQEVFELAFPGCDVVEAGGVATITRSTRVIPIGDYPVNLAIVGRQSGTGLPVVAMIKRPMVINGMSLPMTPNSEATTALTAVGHYDPANIEEEPWEIRYPLAEDAVTLRKLVLPPGLTVADDADPGDIIGSIAGLTADTTRVTTNPMFAVSGSNLVVGSAALSAGIQTFAIVESGGDAVNSPMATGVTVVVTAA